MNRKITIEETNQLFKFCRDHYVYHYDLQVELVDHLASSIEEQWESNPELSFEKALYNTFKRFGVTGFSKIKEQKQKELARRYNILLWKYLLEFYRWPKMLMTLAGTMILFTLLKMVNSIVWVIVPYFIIITIVASLYYYLVSRKQLKNIAKLGKKFMILEYLKQVQFVVILLSQTPVNMLNISRFLDLHTIHQNWALLLISFLIISLNIVFYGYFFYIPFKVKEHFREQFPEFAL